jgi:hypothetical protein
MTTTTDITYPVYCCECSEYIHEVDSPNFAAECPYTLCESCFDEELKEQAANRG